MKLKPRFSALFFIYLIFGGVFTGILIFIFSYRLGFQTEENYRYFVENAINDTIVEIGELGPLDYAFAHGGMVETVKLKNNSERELALYLENYKHIDNIEAGDSFIKNENSKTITIKSNEKSFDIVLRNLTELREQKRKGETIKWIVIYLIIGVVMLFVPLKLNKK